ncbi:transcriptional regulator, Crp/Fnr family [Deinococcus proteolyticus MRP]|uniref:Transcriptional regulator, Crp/Fnr family n=1 Tax=Deinococcus proteolyticus (strain ATCC 35074 / DSM 20540 / JCM 6276 / NBRC 101906 / NCIMB 13154 / VKM Ac-1939 / CCM 2703 / MRP) TaxID=693977 RepID=F0RNJ7_DEIPM|nr:MULTISPECIES: Crp/Fnr family transcriptional regulator [Deinococcus]ADY26323.1 transcriptional regulator, Crp/Fnr family [Deinococcus proteolyticus MRP]MCY1702441.1 Crp/Fnr family transcriptional regulator [Deinococcus sp. SL84]
MNPQDQLRENPLFGGVTEETIREAGRVAVPYHFEEGEVLLSQDRGGELLHLLTSGAVRVSRLGTGQLERTVSELYAPNLVGESALLLGGERSATVTATLPSSTLALHRPHLEMIARRDPRLLWNLAHILAARVRDLNDELIACGHSTDAALAHVMRNLYRQRVQAGVPEAAALPLTHSDLMVRLSASRETVSRVLKRFQKQGIIRVSEGRLHLLRPEVLEGYDPEGE